MNKIGITINIKDNIFSNGISQNAIFLAELISKIGYSVELICDSENTYKKLEEITLKNIDISLLEDSFKKSYDLIIALGFIIEKSHFEMWKSLNKNVKLVSYQCGNRFLIEMEKCLFQKQNKDNFFDFTKNKRQTPHQIWSIPQMENSCTSVYQFVESQENLTVVPFVWNSHIVEQSFSSIGAKPYEPRDIFRCSVMEPNISVMKNVFIPIITLEKNQKVNPLKEIYLFGANVLKDSAPFVDFIKSTDIYKTGVATVESRFKISTSLSKYTDFVLSWQWENNLNYLYLDVAWLGWPIVHNGSLCKDIGYYYEGFNSDEAVEKISEVISTHNLRWKEYREENRKRIERYTDSNTRMLNEYKFLIENVLNDRFVKGKYDWETNSCFSNHVSL